MSENQGYRQDSWYSSSNQTNDPIIFYGINEIFSSTVNNNDDTLVEYQFREGNNYSVYQRKYYDIFSVLAVAGGIYSSVYLIGFAFTIMFSYNLLMSSLIRQLYTFKTKFDSELPKEKKKKKGVHDDETDGGGDTGTDYEKIGLYDDEKVRKAKELKAAELEKQKTGKDTMISTMVKGFGSKNAANFDMKTGTIIKHYICCRLIMGRQTLRNSPRMRTDYYFYQGLDRLNKECDLAHMIKNIRIMRYFLKTVLTKDQRVLLKLKNKDVVPSADESKPVAMKKKLNKKLLLENYVDFMSKKKLSQEDSRLFKVLGQEKAYELLEF